MRVPPLLPEETLIRVLRLARFNGLSVLGIAGFFALMSAAAHNVPGAAVGVLVAGAGALELHGAGLLRHGDDRGTDWLVGSQLYLLVVMLGYVAFRLNHVDIEPVRQLLTADQLAAIAATGATAEEMLRSAYTLTYAILGAATFGYQGGMALYYHRRRAPIAAALSSDSEK